MLVVWVLTALCQAAGVPACVDLWSWFGAHPLLTVLLLIFLA